MTHSGHGHGVSKQRRVTCGQAHWLVRELPQMAGLDPMGRREFITLVGGVAATWPLGAYAQQAKRLPLIAIVYSVGAVSDMVGADPLGVNVRAFERGLRDLGWIDGRTVMIERRSAEGQL